jgi:hypothetical protein
VSAAARLDLSRPRTLGELLGTTFALFGRYTTVFATVTAVVVVPYVVLVDGVWGHRLAHGSRAHAPPGWFAGSALIGNVLVPAMVTALFAVIVRGLSRGEEPTVNAAMSSAADRLAPAVAAVALFAVGVVIGFFAFVVPGLWLLVRWYFGAQAAVIDEVGPAEALRNSATLVKGRWWSTAGRLLVGAVVFALIVAPLSVAAALVHQGVVYTLLAVVIDTVSRSLAALYGTLLFFDLRARREPPPPATTWLPPV